MAAWEVPVGNRGDNRMLGTGAETVEERSGWPCSRGFQPGFEGLTRPQIRQKCCCVAIVSLGCPIVTFFGDRFEEMALRFEQKRPGRAYSYKPLLQLVFSIQKMDCARAFCEAICRPRHRAEPFPAGRLCGRSWG